MRKQYLGVVVVVVAFFGCAPSLRYGRLSAYQALPVAPEQFDRLDAYTAALFPKPFQLHVSERGTAWLLLVRQTDGHIEQAVAVEFDGVGSTDGNACPTAFARLIALMPGDPRRFDGAQGLLIAHDGQRCFGADGATFPCATSDAWVRAGALQKLDVPSRKGNPTDAALHEWYARRLLQAGVRDRNTTLSDAEWRRIRWEESTWKDAADASPTAVGGGLAAGLLAGVIPGVVIGGVAFVVRFPMLLAEPSRGPEYGDQPMPAQAVAALAESVQRCTRLTTVPTMGSALPSGPARAARLE